MHSIQDISTKAYTFVDQSHDKTILGANLGFLLRTSFPGFKPYHFQAKNLRDFVKRYVPTLSEKGRSGLDVIYTIKSVTSQPPTPLVIADSAPSHVPPKPSPINLITSPSIWRAYLNPSHPFVVVANLGTGELNAVAETQTIVAPWVLVPKPSSDYQKQIAGEFAASLSEPIKSILEGVLLSRKWYIQFTPELQRVGIDAKWFDFRRSKLIAKFEADLRNLGIPGVRTEARKEIPPPSNLPPHPVNAPSSAPTSDESTFRDLVKRVIEELPISELRLLRLPVGVVFDALRR